MPPPGAGRRPHRGRPGPGRRRRPAAPPRATSSLRPQDVPEPPVRRLRGALQRVVVHVHQPEAARVPLGPLEVVQQGPDEVAAHVHARLQRGVQGTQMGVQVGDALLVVQALVGAAVLGDDDRRQPVAVAVAEVAQQLGQPLRDHRPAEVGERTALDLPYRERKFGRDRQSAELRPRAQRGAHPGRRVVVDAVPVERLRDHPQVGGDVPGHQLAEPVRVRAQQHRLREEAVEQRVVEARRRHVVRVGGGRPGGPVGVGDADVARARRAQRPHRETMGEELVVGDREGVEQQPPAGGVRAQGVAQQGVFGGLVERDPLGDPVAQPAGDRRHMVGEAGRRVPLQPVQAGGQVPVEEGRHRADARRAQLVHQPVVEVQAARGGDPGPGDRETVGVHTEIREQGHVLGVAVVVVAGHRGRGAVLHPARLGGEHVPHGRSAQLGRALDLMGGGGDTPQEAGREPGERIARVSRHGGIIRTPGNEVNARAADGSRALWCGPLGPMDWHTGARRSDTVPHDSPSADHREARAPADRARGLPVRRPGHRPGRARRSPSGQGGRLRLHPGRVPGGMGRARGALCGAHPVRHHPHPGRHHPLPERLLVRVGGLEHQPGAVPATARPVRRPAAEDRDRCAVLRRLPGPRRLGHADRPRRLHPAPRGPGAGAGLRGLVPAAGRGVREHGRLSARGAAGPGARLLAAAQGGGRGRRLPGRDRVQALPAPQGGGALGGDRLQPVLPGRAGGRGALAVRRGVLAGLLRRLPDPLHRAAERRRAAGRAVPVPGRRVPQHRCGPRLQHVRQPVRVPARRGADGTTAVHRPGVRPPQRVLRRPAEPCRHPARPRYSGSAALPHKGILLGAEGLLRQAVRLGGRVPPGGTGQPSDAVAARRSSRAASACGASPSASS
ncbi:hypothetical protein SGPA1_30559 [Streptomyces misionensis JCM 4497]